MYCWIENSKYKHERLNVIPLIPTIYVPLIGEFPSTQKFFTILHAQEIFFFLHTAVLSASRVRHLLGISTTVKTVLVDTRTTLSSDNPDPDRQEDSKDL